MQLVQTERVELQPETGLVGAASWAIWKLVGPAAGEVAEAMRRWTETRTRNIGRVLEMAAEEAGDELDRPGQVHPRVAHHLLEEGSYCDDEVMQRYLAGMLRAARTEDGRDDRAAYYVNVLASLTANQVRLHHAVYAALAQHDRRPAHDLRDAALVHRVSVRAPVAAGASLLTHDDNTEPVDALAEAALGLSREGLIGPDVSLDSKRGLRYDQARERHFAVVPSGVGALLYLWGRGHRTARADDLGRIELRRLDPPGPTLAEAEVGPWFPGPTDERQLVDRMQEELVMRERLSGT